MVTTDLSQCLISNNDGIVSSFLNIEKHHNEDLEMCRIAKLEKLEKDIMRVHFLLEPGSIQVIYNLLQCVFLNVFCALTSMTYRWFEEI